MQIPRSFIRARYLRLLFVLTVAFFSRTVLAIGPYSYNATGDEVIDTATGLVWKRCIAGNIWDGITCTGSNSAFTHELALAYAQGQAGWRLPSVKELSTIVDSSRRFPSIDTIAFPNSPSYSVWTSTPFSSNSGFVWYAGFLHGDVRYADRSYQQYVRLVR